MYKFAGFGMVSECLRVQFGCGRALEVSMMGLHLTVC
jgi:hypothetical protein